MKDSAWVCYKPRPVNKITPLCRNAARSYTWPQMSTEISRWPAPGRFLTWKGQMNPSSARLSFWLPAGNMTSCWRACLIVFTFLFHKFLIPKQPSWKYPADMILRCLTKVASAKRRIRQASQIKIFFHTFPQFFTHTFCGLHVLVSCEVFRFNRYIASKNILSWTW